MTDLESRVRATLAERAARTEAPAGLGERASRRGRTVRRRRAVLGTAALALVLAGAFVVAPRLGAPAPGGTTLPVETAAPPGGIGSDRGLLHFDVDLARLPGDLAARIVMTQWASGEGYEQFAGYDAQQHAVVTVVLGADAAGRLAENGDAGPTRVLRWERDGVAGATMLGWDERDLLPAVGRAVRLDVVQRCVLPLRLAEVPAEATWSECLTRVRRGGPEPRWANGGLTIRRADGHQLFVWVDGAPTGLASFAPDRTVGPWAAQWQRRSDGSGGLWIGHLGGLQVFVTPFERPPADWFTPEVAGWYAARLTPVDDLAAPSGWPRRAVGP